MTAKKPKPNSNNSSKPLAVPAIRDRIIDFRRVPASSLAPHPLNWRRHPDEQRAGLRAVLREIGWAGAALARELPDGGGLQLIDGHLRQEVAGQDAENGEGDGLIPILVLDVTEEEALKILASYDPLGAMAEADAEQLAAVLTSFDAQDGEFLALLEGLAAREGVDAGAWGGNGSEVVAPTEFNEVDESIETEHQCPKCGYQWSGGGG